MLFSRAANGEEDVCERLVTFDGESHVEYISDRFRGRFVAPGARALSSF
jgi:hypothetical protein